MNLELFEEEPMPRGNFFIRLSAQQAEALDSFMKTALHEHGVRARCRAQAVWFSHEGKTVSQIARFLRVSERSIWKWLKAYKEKGLEGLKGTYYFRKL